MQNLYIIECQHLYKIGVANDIKARLAQLATGNPFPLKVEIYYVFENAVAVEKVLHQKYSELRIRGEWFDLKDYNVLKEIHQICLLLGGRAFEYDDGEATNKDIEDAEDFQQEVFDEIKRGRPRSDAWRLEFCKDGDIVRARLRRGSNETRKSNFVSLGTIEDVYFNNPEWKDRCVEYCERTGYRINFDEI